MTTTHDLEGALPATVDARALALLRGRLDRVVEARPSLAGARELLLRPVELLAHLDEEVDAVLADDPLAAARTRLLLAAAGGFEVDSETVERLVADAEDAPLETTARALIHLGSLVTVGLAAIRAGKAVGHEQHFLSTVHGLALFAGAAETLARLGPEGPRENALGAVLAGIASRVSDHAASRHAALTGLVYDPGERSRWRCLNRLFGEEGLQREVSLDWGGGSAAGIDAIVPRSAAPGARVELRGAFPGKRPAATDVVFAWSERRVAVAVRTATVHAWTKGAIAVSVPENARAGWVGFATAQAMQRANEVRLALRARWSKPEPCLQGALVPIERIALFTASVVPPRTRSNTFEGGEPTLYHAALVRSAVAPGEDFELAWESGGANRVELVAGEMPPLALPPAGTSRWPAPLRDGPVPLELTPQLALDNGEVRSGTPIVLEGIVRSPSRIVDVTVMQGGRPAPLRAGVAAAVAVSYEPATARAVVRVAALAGDGAKAELAATATGPGAAHFELAAAHARDGSTLVATLAADAESGPHDRRVVGPLRFVTEPPRELVLVRPSVAIDGDRPRVVRIERDAAAQVIARACAQAGLHVVVRELPCASDALGAIAGAVEDADDPRVARLLVELARTAARSPGLEHAAWLALLPGENAVVRHAPAAAAARIVVATASGLAAWLAADEPFGSSLVSRAKATVLRVIGEISTEGTASILDVREERRARGPGATDDSGYALVALDDRERELATQRVRVLHAASPLAFEALVPLAPHVARVELRRVLSESALALASLGGRARAAAREARASLATLLRPTGRPRLASVAVENGHVRWTVGHGSGLVATLALEARVLPGAIATVDDGGDGHDVPVVRSSAPLAAADSEPAWTPFGNIDPCPTRASVNAHRLGYPGDAAQAVRLSAADGWYTEAVALDVRVARGERVVARALDDGRFAADVPSGWQVRWSLGDRELGELEVLALPTGVHGVLQLSARDPQTGAEVHDRRWVGPPAGAQV